MRISDTLFFVTGGSSGLGLATVKSLVQKGAYVGILDTQDGSAVAKSLGNNRVAFAHTDVTDEKSVARAFLSIQKKWTGILVGGVVHCAGIGSVEAVLGRDGKPNALSHFKNVININYTGSFIVAGQFAALIVEQNKREEVVGGVNKNGRVSDGIDRGVIILVSSVSESEGQMGMAAYASSKAAVNGLVLPLAREFSKFGIRVQSIVPTMFSTPMGTTIANPKLHDSLMAATLFPPRFGKPVEFAQLALTIIENQMLNGGTIRIDGGSRVPKM